MTLDSPFQSTKTSQTLFLRSVEPCGTWPQKVRDRNQYALLFLFELVILRHIIIPTVGLGFGYGLEADVFSFGMILWEVCALKKPFCNIKSAAEFEDTVFVKNLRPKMKRKWNEALKNLISECWSPDPQERPVISVVKSIIAALTEEFSRRDARGNSNSLGKSLRRSIARRVTWD